MTEAIRTIIVKRQRLNVNLHVRSKKEKDAPKNIRCCTYSVSDPQSESVKEHTEQCFLDGKFQMDSDETWQISHRTPGSTLGGPGPGSPQMLIAFWCDCIPKLSFLTQK